MSRQHSSPGAFWSQITASRSCSLISAIIWALDGKAVGQPPNGETTPGWSKSAMKIGNVSITGKLAKSGYINGVKKSTPTITTFGLAVAISLAQACASFWSTTCGQ